MYSKWTSLTNKLYNRSCCENLEENSVLCKFPPNGGKQVAILIVKQLCSSFGITQATEPSNLTCEKEVLWCMEVICYGLTLPLTEHDIVRDCVNVYCEWLSAMYPTPKISVPVPVCKDPNFFARKIMVHFLNLFMPRSGEVWSFIYLDIGSDIINKQAVLCHRVLRTLQQVTQISKNIENDTWQTLLLFLLTINDTLLAPPTVKDDVGDQLCERVLSVLLEVWLIACIKCYPSPPLWKTLREMAINWRHRTALIEQWNRINLTLTSRILEIMYGVSFPQLKIGGDEDLQSTVNGMTDECVVQTWFRILHTIGNPVDLCHSNIISQTPQFLQYAITNDNPSEHPCLAVLPLNFYKAIKGVASLVDAFLGTPVFIQWEDYPNSNPASGSTANVSSHPAEFYSPTPPSRRRLAKSFSVTSSKLGQKSSLMGLTTSRSNALITANATANVSAQVTSSFGSSSLNYVSHYGSNNRNAFLSPLRPKCNSVLHLFGEWLFQASYNLEIPLCMPLSTSANAGYGTTRSSNWGTACETGSISSSGSISSFLLRKGSSSQPNSLTTDSSDTDTASSTPLTSSLSTVAPSFSDKFVCGRAEAVGTLCRIFCSKKTGEEILPIYLSRFYIIIQQSLRVKECGDCDEVIASVLLNSSDIFSLDLDGVLLLVPYFLEALEIVLSERHLRFNENAALMTTAGNIGAATSSVTNIPSYAAAPIPSANAAVSTTTTGFTSTSLSTTAVASSNIVPTFGGGSVNAYSGGSYPVTSNMNTSSSSSSTISVSDAVVDPSNAFNASSNLSLDDGSVTLTPVAALAMSNAVNVSSASIASNASNVASSTAISSTASVPLVELRKACIHLLLSMFSLPLHFQNLPLKEFGHTAYRINFSSSGNVTFGQLKPRLVNLLINALQIETDSCNIHLLLGGLLCAIQDSALCEQTNFSKTSQADSLNEAASTVPALDSAHSLFVRSMHLVCLRLTTSWKIDLNVSLAALEFLTGLARIQIREIDIVDCKRAVKWLCDFIVYQCFRPPQAHSKDLHSSIVAAFQCTSHWLISHPSLLSDKECLNTLLEVVELGISGTKSQGKLSEPVRMKDEKELKPVSMRVRDAAEALLTIILEHITESGTSSALCLLDEVILVKQCSTSLNDSSDPFTYEQAVSKFHYFLFENNIMIALLQEPLGNDQDPQPTITLLIRNSFGRHAWTLQLRHLPRHRSTAKQSYGNSSTATTGRPISMNEACSVPVVHQRYFPDCISKIEAYKVDKSIPSLETVGDDANDDPLESLLELQYQAEMDFSSSTATESFNECNPPSTCHEFYTARMFLSHLGLLSKYRSSNKQGENSSLIALDNRKEGFARELKNLDEITGKTCDTCHVFYVKSGQKRHTDILENATSRSSVNENFLELLYSLGWPVKVDQHIGWTGHVSTSFKISHGNETSQQKFASQYDPILDEDADDGPCLYDGSERVLYWCDAISEIAFVVPSLRQQALARCNVGTWYERTISVSSETALGDKANANTVSATTDKMRTLSLDSSTTDTKDNKPTSVFSKKKSTLVTVVMLVWLESFEDHNHFPINELLSYTNTGLEGNTKVDPLRDSYIIFLHALQNGLLRIKLQGPVNRINIAIPLVDGMIISRRSAGQLIRQTVLNICKKRRLDSDSYQLPHVRRRLKIQEIKEKFESKMDPPELLTYLLKNC